MAQSGSSPLPLYDLFLDLPHPSASKSCPGPFLIPSPIQNNAEDLHNLVPQVARFAYPEFDESIEGVARNDDNAPSLNKYDVYIFQNTSFLQFTFTLQLQSGTRLHGHVRRYMPPHLTARTRYDVGRRGERALIILTRNTGADLLYASILKCVCIDIVVNFLICSH
jgi:hypothetical protein